MAIRQFVGRISLLLCAGTSLLAGAHPAVPAALPPARATSHVAEAPRARRQTEVVGSRRNQDARLPPSRAVANSPVGEFPLSVEGTLWYPRLILERTT